MKTPEAARRPGFPLRLKPDTGLPSATKNIANNARIESPKGLNDNNNVLQKPVPAGLGQDSLAVRTRMPAGSPGNSPTIGGCQNVKRSYCLPGSAMACLPEILPI